MQFITHNQRIKLFTDIATNHKQIHSFGFGELFDMSHSQLLYSDDIDANLQAPAYPLMWAFAKGGQLNNTVATTAAEYRATYTVAVCDKYHSDNSNIDEILSDCEQICLDIITVLQSPDYYDSFYVDKVTGLNISGGISENDDSAIGWTFDITFRMPYSANRCAVPLITPQT
jgi:hypothetical protein